MGWILNYEKVLFSSSQCSVFVSVWVVQWEEKQKVCGIMCLFYKDKDCIVLKRNFDSVDLWEICAIVWETGAEERCVCLEGRKEEKGEGWGGWAVGRTRGILVWFCGSWYMCLCDQKVDPREEKVAENRVDLWFMIYDLKTLQCEKYLLGPVCMMDGTNVDMVLVWNM